MGTWQLNGELLGTALSGLAWLAIILLLYWTETLFKQDRNSSQKKPEDEA
ncbi:MAG: hypothetical protein Q7O66_12600 [Dehalococcoidia bacterium]|nr:hypothetical protein [Dehalococcoidia bacterium]